jgi:hypothetical protein
MNELHDAEGVFAVDGKVAKALEHLAVALAEQRMSATVALHPPGEEKPIEFTLGIDRASEHSQAVRARPATGEASHLGIEEF